MPWFPEIATPAFCETLNLRKIILDSQTPSSFVGSTRKVLEPGSAEFIAALAAGSNSRNILHVGCGLSTIALAAAAKATGGCLACVDIDKVKQAAVLRYVLQLGLGGYVRFFLEDPSQFISRSCDGFDFVLFTGEPQHYIELFDLLKLTHSGIIVAYNALDDATNDYIKHVRQQPGIDSSTLPVGRGIEVSKILSWDTFKNGRKTFCYCCNDESASCSWPCYENDAAAAEEWNKRARVQEGGHGTDFHDRFLSSSTSSLQEVTDALSELRKESIKSPGTDFHDRTCSSSSSLQEEEDGRNQIDSASVGTSLGEEGGRVADESSSRLDADILLQLKNVDLHTEIKVEGPDGFMLLTDITMALNEANVSIQEAKISTQNNHVEDVFYVVDGQTKSFLDMDRQEFVRSTILKKIAARRQTASA